MEIILLLFTFLAYSVNAENDCGDWAAYKDDKCVKLFDSAGLQSFTDAEKTCSANENSKLPAIYSQEEQAFLARYLFTEKAAVDNVWLGARYSNASRHFQWEDGSNITHFTNWAPGNPKAVVESHQAPSSLQSCVQMHAETEILGRWSNEPCAKKNLVVCEKEQRWSLEKMQLMIKKMARQQQQTPPPTTSESTVPLGFIYVQLPKEKGPSEIWPKHLVWTEVSQAYSGVFFRVIGGEAAQFGTVQQESLPFIDQIEYADCEVRPKNRCNFTTLAGAEMSLSKTGGNGGWSGNVITAAGFNVNEDSLNIEGGTKYTGTLNFHTKSAEVRPRNMAVRVWKRTG